MRGVVVKCSMDRVRKAIDEEWLGAELIRVLSQDALQHIRRQGQRGYVDTSHEEPPPDDNIDTTIDLQHILGTTDPVPSEDPPTDVPMPMETVPAREEPAPALVPVAVAVNRNVVGDGRDEFVPRPEYNVPAPGTPNDFQRAVSGWWYDY